MQETGFRSPEEAEDAFYKAFQAADVDAMMAVWADEQAIVCIHPMGPRLQGPDDIRESWRQIFDSGAALLFELSDVQYTQGNRLSVHYLLENITYGPHFEQRSVVITTNVYAQFDTGWHMVAHHASPGNSLDAEPADPTQTLH